MLKTHLDTFYSGLKIRGKVTVPFVLSFALLWVLGTSFLGAYFSRKLTQSETEAIDKISILVREKLDDQLNDLRTEVRLLTRNERLSRAVEDGDVAALRQEILPLNAILEDEWIAVFDLEQNLLVELRKPPLKEVKLLADGAVKQALSGASVATLVNSETQGLSLLVGTATIENEAGFTGGMLIGKQLSNQLLSLLSEELRVELIAWGDNGIIAQSFSEAVDVELLGAPNRATSVATINGQRYFQVSIPLKGLGGNQVNIWVLSDRSSFEQTRNTIWGVVVLVGVGGVLLATVLGAWAGHHIAKPIQELAETADRVSQAANFEALIYTDSQDEVGTLTRSLNKLLDWSRFYTQELKTANHSLEQKVQERTEGLELALHELKNTQVQLIQTEKMSSLGQMVAGIAHEINNPINFIKGNVSHLEGYFADLCELVEQYQETYEPTPELQDTIDDIDLEFLLEDTSKILGSLNLGTNRVRDIVVAMRNFSRLDEAEVKAVDIHEGIESTLIILNNRLKYGFNIVKDYGKLPLIECYPAQLNQVFTNIITNAADAMEDANSQPKQITISTRAIADKEIEISFKDTGPGMPKEIQNKIFDPFFTTKAVGKGTGLGLGICYQIIQKHAGDIQVISQLGEGTEFKVVLPLRNLVKAVEPV